MKSKGVRFPFSSKEKRTPFFANLVRSDSPRGLHNPADPFLGQFAMDAAVGAQDIARLAALGDQAFYLPLDLLPGSGVQKGARTVVKPAPDRAAELLFGRVDIHDIDVAGPADHRRFIILPDRQPIGVPSPAACGGGRNRLPG